jgi:sigma-B regulation protein RsbU (phosphoserine phosphatase)
LSGRACNTRSPIDIAEVDEHGVDKDRAACGPRTGDWMTAATASLRLTEFVDSVAPADVAGDTAGKIMPVETQLDIVQRELDKVRDELDQLRRRDDTLRFYLHRLDEELRLAARVQQDFLPKSMPKVGGIRFQTLFRPVGHVSGDLYDVMRLDESHVGFYMADAVGHGMPAALLTMFLKQALVTKEILASGYRLLSPAQTMQRLNEALVSQNLSQATFATALYGNINVKTLEMTFARGGHPLPMLIKRGGEMKVLEAEGSLLGIFPEEPFTQTTVQLQVGDRLFVYSDGVELAFSDERSVDASRWQEELTQRRTMPTEQILKEFADHIDAGGEARRKDDLTIIVLDVEAQA